MKTFASFTKMVSVALISLAPALSMAGPSGHQICRATVNGKKIQLIYGTYGNSGDAELKINGHRLTFDANDNSNPNGEGLVFTATKPGVGSIKWISTSEAASSIPLSVRVGSTRFKNKILRCHTLDYTEGQEQN